MLFCINLNRKGFTLVELLISIAIIAILSVSAVVGFGYLEDNLKAREITGFMSDVIKQEELKVLRGDFITSKVNFFKDYLAVNETPEDTELNLSLISDNSCTEGYKLKYGDNGSLIKKDSEGRTIEVKNVLKNDTECLGFKNAEETEWNYQLIDSDKYSNYIRLIHFNIQRDNLNNLLYVADGAGSKIEISAPYGKKLIYDKNGDLIDDPSKPDYHVQITVEDGSGNSSDSLLLE